MFMIPQPSAVCVYFNEQLWTGTQQEWLSTWPHNVMFRDDTLVILSKYAEAREPPPLETGVCT